MLRTSYSAKNVVWYRHNNIVLGGMEGGGGANTKSQKFLHQIVTYTACYSRDHSSHPIRTLHLIKLLYPIKLLGLLRLGLGLGFGSGFILYA